MISTITDAESALSDASAADVAALLAAAADIVLVLDGDGVIVDLAFDLEDGAALDVVSWRGRALIELIEAGSRASLRSLLAAAHGRRHGLRQVLRHSTPSPDEFAVTYVALPLGTTGRVVLVGRDQRALNQLQTRLVTERMDYERRRREQLRDDARYRQLFEGSSDASLLVDAATGLVREANTQAAMLLGVALTDLRGARFSRLFERAQRAELQMLCDAPPVAPPATPLMVTTEASRAALQLSAQAMHGDERGQLLVRLQIPIAAPPPSFALEARLATLLRNAADAVVLTDTRGGIVWGNESFLRLVGLGEVAVAAGRTLADFLEFDQLELTVLLANLRRYSSAQTMRGALRMNGGQFREVEVSVTALLEDAPPGVGFLMRTLEPSYPAAAEREIELFRSAEELTELVGKVPLKGMVRDATDKVEKMCIEAALRLTGNNRALAAKVLGMSRQGLYQKLHQFNLAAGDDAESETQGE